jgi:hypothetical protein
VPGQVVDHLAAAGRMADVNGVLQIEMCRQRGQVVGVVVHVVAVAGLGGSPVAAPVMGDDAIAVLDEEQHLRVPVVSGQGPAVAEHDRLAGTPVFVEDLGAVICGDGAHRASPLLGVSLEPGDPRLVRGPVAAAVVALVPGGLPGKVGPGIAWAGSQLAARVAAARERALLAASSQVVSCGPGRVRIRQCPAQLASVRPGRAPPLGIEAEY